MRVNRLLFNRSAAYGLFGLLAFLLQSSVMPHFAIGGVKPQLLLGCIVCVALREGEATGGIFGGLIGLLCDWLVSPVSGFYTFCFVLLGAVLGFCAQLLLRNTLLSAVVVGAGATFGFSLLSFFAFHQGITWQGLGTALLRVCLPELIYTLPFLVLAYYAVRAMGRLIYPSEESQQD